MSKPRKQDPHQPQKRAEISPEMLRQFIEVQKQTALNDARRLDLQRQELTANTKLAEKSIDAQVSILKSQPAEKRKSLNQIFWFSGVMFIVLLSFLAGCLYLGKEEFAKYLLGGVFYIASLVVSYQMGKKSSKDKQKDTVQEAEVVDS